MASYTLNEILIESGLNYNEDHNKKDRLSKTFRAMLRLTGAKRKWFLSATKKGCAESYIFYECDKDFFKFIDEIHENENQTFNEILQGKNNDINAKKELRQKTRGFVKNHLNCDEYFKKIYNSIKSTEKDKKNKAEVKINKQISKIENYKKDIDDVAIEKYEKNKIMKNKIDKLQAINFYDKQYRLTDEDVFFLYEQFTETLSELESLFLKISNLRKDEYITLLNKIESDKNYSFYTQIRNYLNKNNESVRNFIKNEKSKRKNIEKEYFNYIKIIKKHSKDNSLDKKIKKNLKTKRFSYKKYKNISEYIDKNTNNNLKNEAEESNAKLQKLISEYINYYNYISEEFGEKMIYTKNIKCTYKKTKNLFKEAIKQGKKFTKEILSQNQSKASL